MPTGDKSDAMRCDDNDDDDGGGDDDDDCDDDDDDEIFELCENANHTFYSGGLCLLAMIFK